MRTLALLTVIAGAWATLAAADEGIQPETLVRIKGATVFVKVDAAGQSSSGSGFVIKVDGDTAYVVTNHHVIEPKVSDAAQESGHGFPFPRGPMFGPRGPMLGPFGPRFGLTPRLIVQTLKNAKATVILYSGTTNEEQCPAEVMAADPDLDLAVLKVAGIRQLPQPVGLDHDPKLTETMPVYVFGFPFGDVLATGKGNPAITIGKGSISSLRLDKRGELTLVQIDGALNPGNSGGPVVDSRGQLVGVAVATIKESTGIGLAIPPQHLSRVLQGRVSKAHLRPSVDKDGIVTVHVEVNLVDPLGRLKSVALHYLAANQVPANIKASDRLLQLPNCQTLPLRIEGRLATAELRLPKGVAEFAVRYQVTGVNDAEHESHTESVAETIRTRPASPAGPLFAGLLSPDGGTNPSDGKGQPSTPRVRRPPSFGGRSPSEGPGTDIVGHFGTPFENLAPEGAVLVGFEAGMGKFGSHDIVVTIRPVFQPRTGEEILGKQHGTDTSRPVRLRAKEGYAVGAITAKAGLALNGFSVTFMKLDKDALDPKDAYESDWLGSKGGSPEKTLGGDGRLVVGIIGREDQKDCKGLGLFLKGPATGESQPSPRRATPSDAMAASRRAAPSPNTNEFSPKTGSFSITMPDGQTSSGGGMSLSINGIPLAIEMKMRGSDGVAFIAQSIGLGTQAMRAMSAAEKLQLFRDALSKQCEATIVGEEPIEQGSRRGREFHLEGRGKFSRAQMYYVVGGEVLCAIVTGNTQEDLTSQKATDFFASFKVAGAE